MLAGRLALGIVGFHDGHDFVPGAGQGFAQLRVVLEGVAVDHHQVDDLAGDLAGIKHLADFRCGFDFGQQGVPGGHGGHVVGGEGGHHVGIGGVDHLEVLLGQLGAFQAAGQQVVRHGQFHQIDVLALEVGQGLVLALDHDAVVAVGEVADDQGGAVHAAGGRDGQGVHVGHGAAVELAGAVLVDRLDVVVELHHIDIDAVLLRPLVDDAFGLAVFPRHPAGVDGPADAEMVFLLGEGRLGEQGAEAGGEERSEQGLAHGEPPVRWNTGRSSAAHRWRTRWRVLPGFCPAV